MTEQTEVAIVAGVGASRGLGAALARRFAREGYHVVAAGRTQEKLDKIVDELHKANNNKKATAVRTDITDINQVDQLFTTAAGIGPIAAVLYNAGNNTRLPFLDITAQQFENIWRTGCLGGFLVGQAAVRHMLPRGQGTILYTGATASLRGRPNFAPFASAKAALRNMVQSMAREFGPRGIHIGHVIIDGVIDGEIARDRFNDYLDSLGKDGALDPDAIADSFWAMHTQNRTAWTHELDVRPFKETW